MNRPTIADLAQVSGVSVSTVNRILGGSTTVKPATLARVREAAEAIGFYGLNVIEARRRESVRRYRFGFLLQQSSRDLYQLFGRKIREACDARQTEEVTADVEFVDLLEPENIAGRLRAMGERCDAVSVIAADHPLIAQAVQSLKARGVPVVAYITDLSAPDRAGYVGTDNWKLGRTAAWFIAQTTQGSGRIAVFIGNHRYQCQDISDASFRSYMREHAPQLALEDSRPTHEEPSQAYAMMSDLLADREDFVGLYIAGGGISGVLRALRESPVRRDRPIRVVCRDIGPETRRGLAEGLITAALCHPLEQTSSQLVQTLLDSLAALDAGVVLQRVVPFEIVTQESL